MLDAYITSFTVGTVEIVANPDYEVDSGGIIGLDEPDRRVLSTPNPGADGGFIGSSLYGLRGVSVTGVVTGRGALGRAAARLALGRACQLIRDINGVTQLQTFAFTLADGRSFTFSGEVTNFSAPQLGVGTLNFSISIVVPDPLLYDPTVHTMGPIGVSTGGGVIIPTLVPFVSAPSSGGRGTAINSGNETSPCTLYLLGPLYNPYISNQTTGQFMQLNYTIPAGLTATIDMADNTITLTGGSGIMQAKVTGSTFWGLVPGENDINFSTGSPSDTGTLTLKWNNGSISI